MAQSRAARKGEKKGKNVPIGDAPHVPISSVFASVPSVGSGVAIATSNVEGRINLERQQAQEIKYPLWKYVTRDQGKGSKLKGGGNVSWACSYCNNHFKSIYLHVKVHMLGLPGCGIGACINVSVAKRKEMEKEANVGAARVVASSKKTRMGMPLHS